MSRRAAAAVAVAAAVFPEGSVAAPDSVVTFNEVHYHPADGPDGSAPGPEWIELHNQMSIDIDLGGWSLRGGVEFTFPEGVTVPGGGFLVVGGTAGQPSGAAGPFAGRLDNAGEEIRLHARHGRMMDRLRYGDGRDGHWPSEADGSGSTLAKRHGDLASGPPSGWAASSQDGGTPGAENFPAPADATGSRVLVSEGASWKVLELPDGGAPPEGWDSAGFDDSGWGSVTGFEGGAGRFLLRRLFPFTGGFEGGDVLVLGRVGGTAAIHVNGEEVGTAAAGVDGDFAAAFPVAGLAFGANVVAVDLAQAEPGGFDAALTAFDPLPQGEPPVPAHVAGAVVVNEIHYHPRPVYSDEANGIGFAERGPEWVELFNRSASAVYLGGWRLRGGADYDFPDGVALAPGGFLVVDSTQFSGNLGDGSDTVRLRDRVGAVVDEVTYFDSGRWPAEADGGGSTLELIDPDTDNRLPGAWRASDESAKSPWVEYRYRASGREPPRSNNPDNWHEFLLGFLDAGEALVDDISVVEDPDGAGLELIQNGTFESDPVGGGAAHWRLLGTHRESTVVSDPAGGGKVLHLVATGEITHTYNNASTTLAGNRRINSASTYEISFRAKWLGGSPQLNTRLYLNRAARTHILTQPESEGTPGAANSRAAADAGPALDRLRHYPAVPEPGGPVRVTLTASDPEGVVSVRLFYSLGGGAWESVPMGGDAAGRFTGVLPGAADREVVQFYAEAEDGAGFTSMLPAAGPGSRALYRVGDGGVSAQRPRNKMRLVMLPDEADDLHTERDAVSNYRWGATVVYNDRDVYYDVGVRLRGAPFGRRGRPGWNIRFGDDRPFRGVHASVVVDGALNMPRGDGTGWITTTAGASVNEMIYNVVANRAGGVPSTYDDIIYFEGARRRDNRFAQLKMMRFEPGYLEEIVEDGDEGSFFKQELIYYPRSTADGRPDGPKNGFDAVNQVDVTYMGTERDAYRFNYLLRSHRDRDDFSGVMAMCRAFDRAGGALRAATEEAIDVDNWMRVLAFNALFGVADTYNNGLAHNFSFFQRPSDGRMMAFPWDLDHACYYATNDSIFGRGSHRAAAVISIPQNRRRYCGHLLDFCNNGFDTAYIAPWVQNLNDVADQSYAPTFNSWISRRRAHVLSELNRVYPQRDFEITSNGGEPFETGQPAATLQGGGWIDVGAVRLVRDGVPGEPLATEWVDGETWQVVVPLSVGANLITLEALDRQGNVVGTDATTVTNTGSAEPAAAGNLVVSEIMFHPAPPTEAEVGAGFTDGDDFEWIELANTSGGTIELDGVRFGNGIDFGFGAHALAPGGRVVLARDAAAFALRNPGVPVAGEFALGLANDGERVELLDRGGGVIDSVDYGDGLPWPPESDGDGYSLTRRSGAGGGEGAGAWRPSALPGGSPGESDSIPLEAGADLLGYAFPGGGAALDLTADGDLVLWWRYRTGADAVEVVPEIGGAEAGWEAIAPEPVAAASAGDGTRVVGFKIDPAGRIGGLVRLRVEGR